MTGKLKKVTFSRTNFMQYFEKQNEPDPLRLLKEKGILHKSHQFNFKNHVSNLFCNLHVIKKKNKTSENKQSRKLEYRWSYQPEENSESLLGNTISNSAEYTRHHRKKHLKNLCN